MPKPYLDQSFDLAVRLFQAPGVWRGTRTVARALGHAGIVPFASVDRIMRGAIPDGRVALRRKTIEEFFSPLRQAA